MKTKHIFALLAMATLVFTASCNKNNGCSRSEKGIVRDFSDSDTCGIVVELVEESMYLEPTNLSEFQTFEDGDLVWVSYKETAGASICGLGEVVQFRCLVPREF